MGAPAGAVNLADEAEKLRRLADAARDRGAFVLDALYNDLAAAVCDREPDTVREALRIGLSTLDRNRR